MALNWKGLLALGWLSRAQPVFPGISFPDFVQNASSSAHLSCISLWGVPVLPCAAVKGIGWRKKEVLLNKNLY